MELFGDVPILRLQRLLQQVQLLLVPAQHLRQRVRLQRVLLLPRLQQRQHLPALVRVQQQHSNYDFI